MDISLPIRILRDIVNRTGLRSLEHVAYLTKGDGSRVTDIDPFIEMIVESHLRQAIDQAFVVASEESTRMPTIGQIRDHEVLVTIDGIDGTGDFIRHVNDGAANPKWLIAMTAVYRRTDATGWFEPVLAFAYQLLTDCLFVLCEGTASLVERPLTLARVHAFDLNRLPADKPRGVIDVYLHNPECRHRIPKALWTQEGPSGYNMASLLACAAVGREPMATLPVNFTSFHYNIWDFALWPVLNAAGFATVDYADFTHSYRELRLEWWGENDAVPGKIKRPLVLAPPGLLTPLRGVVQDR
jgi:hypothetical protein